MIREILNNNQIKTPAYFFDIDAFIKRLRDVKNILGESDLVFAMKANPILIKYVQGYVDGIEVCSPGEYEICMKNGIEKKTVVYSGINKEKQLLQEMAEEGFDGKYTIESEIQLGYLKELSESLGKRINVLIRLTNGSQFGVDKGIIKKIIADDSFFDHFNLIGIQYFSGTQHNNLAEIEEEVREVVMLCDEVNIEYGQIIKNIEFGPGLFFDYFGKESDGLLLLEEFALILRRFQNFHFIIELGRYLAAPCGYYITSVVDYKVNKSKGYAVVDGGIHQIHYYGQMVGIKIPRYEVITRGRQAVDENVLEVNNICGSLCTMKDVMIKNHRGSLYVGDRIVYYDCGAYSLTEGAQLFLIRDLPAIYLIVGSNTIEMIRDVTHTDKLWVYQ